MTGGRIPTVSWISADPWSRECTLATVVVGVAMVAVVRGAGCCCCCWGGGCARGVLNARGTATGGATTGAMFVGIAVVAAMLVAVVVAAVGGMGGGRWDDATMGVEGTEGGGAAPPPLPLLALQRATVLFAKAAPPVNAAPPREERAGGGSGRGMLDGCVAAARVPGSGGRRWSPYVARTCACNKCVKIGSMSVKIGSVTYSVSV